MLFIKICCHFSLVMEKFMCNPFSKWSSLSANDYSKYHALKLTISYGYKPSKRGNSKPKIHNHL